MAGRKWPVEEIPEGGGQFVQVPVGPYRTSVTLSEALSSSNKLMYKVIGRIIEGPIGQPETGEHVGNLLGENFTIGTDQDREAEDPDTWRQSIGARQLRQLFAAAGVVPDEDVDVMVDAVNGKEVIWFVTNRIEAKYPLEFTTDGKPVMAARNRLQRFDPLPPTTVTAPAPAAAPPAPAEPKRPVGRPPKAAAAPATAPAAPAAPKSAKDDPIITCGNCNGSVLRSQFPAHAAKCTAGEEE